MHDGLGRQRRSTTRIGESAPLPRAPGLALAVLLLGACVGPPQDGPADPAESPAATTRAEAPAPAGLGEQDRQL